MCIKMSEILFRGKRKDNGEWVYGYYCKYGYTGKEKHYIIPSYASALYAIEVIPETVGQYITGLTDKNGKKIFKGDIIQTKKAGLKGEKEYRFVIKYGKYIPLEYCKAIYIQWQTIGFYAFDGKRDYQLSCFKELLEVIGNIHDNPELLKGEEEDA